MDIRNFLRPVSKPKEPLQKRDEGPSSTKRVSNASKRSAAHPIPAQTSPPAKRPTSRQGKKKEGEQLEEGEDAGRKENRHGKKSIDSQVLEKRPTSRQGHKKEEQSDAIEDTGRKAKGHAKKHIDPQMLEKRPNSRLGLKKEEEQYDEVEEAGRKANGNTKKPVDPQVLEKRPTSRQGLKKEVEQPNEAEEAGKKEKTHTKKPIDPQAVEKLPWVEKYRPHTLDELAGLQGDKSAMRKLLQWLMDWPRHNREPGGGMTKPKYNAFSSSSGDGAGFRAVLLSGAPGIGKTTCAELCCQQLNLAFRAFNASETRNKKSLEKIEACSEQILHHFPVLAKMESRKKGSKVKGVEHVLIMDEVDGMSGNADRLGMSELIALIKRSHVPVICICNDRQKANIRQGLANYCFDLRFQRPRVEQIRACLERIARAEKVVGKVSEQTLNQIIEASHHDIRQCINALQLHVAGLKGANGQGTGGKNSLIVTKDTATGIFDSARAALSSDTDLLAKQEAFFSDYAFMPLFIHENYLGVVRKGVSTREMLGRMRRAADCIAVSDVVDKQVRTNQAWQLLPDEAMWACALPALFLNGYLGKRIDFPQWFGKNSTALKRNRLMRELSTHTYSKFACGNHALVEDYLPVLRERMYRPLVDEDAEGVKKSLPVFLHYSLQKGDIDAINELGTWPASASTSKHRQDVFTKVGTRAKTALTRALNKSERKATSGTANTFVSGGGGARGGKGKKGAAAAASATSAEGDKEETGGDGDGGDGEEAKEEEEAEVPMEEILYN